MINRDSLCGWILYIATNKAVGIRRSRVRGCVAGNINDKGNRKVNINGLRSRRGRIERKYSIYGEVPQAEDFPSMAL